MSGERYVQVGDQKVVADEAIEKATRYEQKVNADPDKSDAFKKAATDAAVELINQVPPKKQ